MALLTDRTLAASSAITASTLIHIVDVNDFSQNPAGSSYKANLGQLSSFFSGTTFTGGSSNCITDFYVTNIHGCSPLNINPLSEGDVFVGSANTLTVDLTNERVGVGTSSPSEKLHVSGDTLINSQYVMLSDTINPIPTISNFRGFINIQDYNKQIGYSSRNLNSSGETGLYLANDLPTLGQIEMYGSNHVRQGFPLVGVNFYRNKMVISTNNTSDGMVIKSKSDDPSATLWFEIDGASNMVLKGDGSAGSGNGFLGLKLNPDGTEMPSSNLQIGGTGTTGTFKYRDGNQQNGYVLTSDANGNASWQPLSSLSGSSVISVTGVTTSAYTATTSYSYYGVEYTGITNITIPSATGLNGFTFRIKDERGTAATYPITITPVTGNIDGNPSVTMAINYMSLTMVARNNNWWII